MTIEDDLSGWSDIISSAPRTGTKNPAFVAEETNDLDNAYWIHVRHMDGRTAAIIAAREISLDGGGFFDYVRSGRLWPAATAQMRVADGPWPYGSPCAHWRVVGESGP